MNYSDLHKPFGGDAHPSYLEDRTLSPVRDRWASVVRKEPDVLKVDVEAEVEKEDQDCKWLEDAAAEYDAQEMQDEDTTTTRKRGRSPDAKKPKYLHNKDKLFIELALAELGSVFWEDEKQSLQIVRSVSSVFNASEAGFDLICKHAKWQICQETDTIRKVYMSSNGEVTIGTIKYHLRNTNPEAYIQIMAQVHPKKQVKGHPKKQVNGHVSENGEQSIAHVSKNVDQSAVEFLNNVEYWTDADVADYVVKNYCGGSRGILETDGTNIVMWVGHFWKKSDHSILGILLERDVYNDLNDLAVKISASHTVKVTVAHKLRNVKTSSNYISKIKTQLLHTRTPIEFDVKPHLLAFTNGVYNLLENTFRDGVRQDYVSMNVGYDYHTSTKAENDYICNFIEQILPIEDVRDCCLRCLSSCLYGKVLENVIMFSGEGRNGKDTLITGLLNHSLGGNSAAGDAGLYYASSTSVITAPYKGGISQERANMNKKRAVIYSEPSKSDTLKCANLKELTGCPTLNSRGIYSSKTTIQNHGTTLILTNAIPAMDIVDNAINERTIIVPFRCSFLTKERIDELKDVNPEACEEGLVHPVNTFYKSNEFLEANKLPFINLLIRYFADFKRDGYIITRIPKAMLDLKKIYMSDSDDFVSWFYETFEKTDDRNDYVKMKHVRTNFVNSDLYNNLNKKERRKSTYEKLSSAVKANPTLKLYWCEKKEFWCETEKKKVMVYNCLLQHKEKAAAEKV
jgi:phage/plasmid-associated DNA primase